MAEHHFFRSEHTWHRVLNTDGKPVVRFSVRMFALLWAMQCLALPTWAQKLEIGRNSQASPLADTAERVMQVAGQRAGISIAVRKVPLNRSIGLANDGELDGVVYRIAEITQQYPNLVKVPTPIGWNAIAIYGNSKDLETKTLEQIQRMRIGTFKGSTLLQKYTESLNVREAVNARAVFQLLRTKEVDVAVVTHFEAEAALADEDIKDIVRWPYYWAKEPVFFILHKKNIRFVEPLNNALLAMGKEGLIEKIMNEELKKNNIIPLKNKK